MFQLRLKLIHFLNQLPNFSSTENRTSTPNLELYLLPLKPLSFIVRLLSVNLGIVFFFFARLFLFAVG